MTLVDFIDYAYSPTNNDIKQRIVNPNNKNKKIKTYGKRIIKLEVIDNNKNTIYRIKK